MASCLAVLVWPKPDGAHALPLTSCPKTEACWCAVIYCFFSTMIRSTVADVESVKHSTSGCCNDSASLQTCFHLQPKTVEQTDWFLTPVMTNVCQKPQCTVGANYSAFSCFFFHFKKQKLICCDLLCHLRQIIIRSWTVVLSSFNGLKTRVKYLSIC